MVRLFKIVATLEGISLLALLFIAMPLKYIWHNPDPVRIVGMAHGVLFIAYIVLAIILQIEAGGPWKKFLIICAASVIPFGTFWVEKKYFKTTA